jgi:hypothetical protein
MNRIEGWPELLADYIASRREQPFEWATNDCATFATGAVEAITGEVLFVPPYTDVSSAAHYIDENGGVEAIATGLLGEPVPPLQLGRGDIGLVGLEDRQILAVCVGSHFIAPGENHILAYTLGYILMGWRI